MLWIHLCSQRASQSSVARPDLPTFLCVGGKCRVWIRETRGPRVQYRFFWCIGNDYVQRISFAVSSSMHLDSCILYPMHLDSYMNPFCCFAEHHDVGNSAVSNWVGKYCSQ